MTTSDEQIWLASVGAGRWQIAGILSAQHAGIKVLALDGDAAAPGLSVADQSMVGDIRNPQAVVDAVANNGLQLAGAISFAAEVGMRAVGALRDRFALPGPGLDVLGTLCDKAAQRKLWQEAGLANPRFWHAVDNSKQGHAAIADAGEPVIVKPIDSAGSRGITRLAADAGEPEQAAALERAFAASPSGRVIVESILPGREYTVETFADGKTTHVLAVTVKRKVPNTSDTVADELATPDDDPDVLAAISALARRSLETVGYIEGPGHVEVMYAAESGPALVEAAGRGAGYMMFERLRYRHCHGSSGR